MKKTDYDSRLSRRVRDFVRGDFMPYHGEHHAGSRTDPRWKRLREVGTELWFDSGDAEAIGKLWTREFAAVTTNNTLLNREVQKGTYADFIRKAGSLLDEFPELSPGERKLELAFMLNARHGLLLVEKFDAFVSVEEHTALAHDLEGAVNYGRRFHDVCAERFYVKIPLTAAGVLAARRLAAEGIAVNVTLGFSARQNYLITRLAEPACVNVFLGRLNSVAVDNKLGTGKHIGERATLASQAEVRRLRREHGVKTRQIAASLRDGSQVLDLAGVDVMTMPIAVAEEFLASGARVGDIVERRAQEYSPGFNAEAAWARFDTLWDMPAKLTQCIDRLADEGIDGFTQDDLIDYLKEQDCGDVLMRWEERQVAESAAEGKIPQLENWRALLEDKRIGLDSLMSLAGLNSFARDQADMDRHAAADLEAGKDARLER